LGWFGTLTDIDDRRRADEALRESAERHRAFSEALPGMTWSASPDGAIEYAGERWSETRGAPPEKVLGDGWLDGLHPDDRASSKALWQASLATGQPYETSFRARMADGVRIAGNSRARYRDGRRAAKSRSGSA